VLSEASLSSGARDAVVAGWPLPLVTASVMATAAMTAITAAPIQVNRVRRRARAAS
jgi:hypothetical protein